MAAGVPNFDALRDLHDSANDLLHSPVIKGEIATKGQEKLVHEASEASLRMLEACGTTKDVLLRVKDHLHDLHWTFRRISFTSGGGETPHNNLQVYQCDRKKLRKDMMKRINSLKSLTNNNSNNSNNNNVVVDDSVLIMVVVNNVLRQVRATTISMVELLMSLMAMPCPNNGGRTRKGGSSPSSLFGAAKLKRVNSLRCWEKCDDAMTIQCATKRLEAVEMAVGDLEGELECIIRRLIRTRVSLLNILTN